jgi:protein-disulfide isomerase
MRFKKNILLLASLILTLMAIVANAEVPATIVGVYDKLPGAEFTFDGNTIEVVEYMSFYCHTCYDFEKSIPIIRGNYPGKIKWKIVPIYWVDHGSPKPGEAYLIAAEMGKGEAMKKALFHAQMVQKKNIADINVLEGIGKEVGLGPEFGKKLRAGEKSGETQKALELAKKIGINETPTVVIAGNLKTDPHPMNHDLNTFRANIMAIIHSILNQK